jgi:hypothetical protein
MLGREDMTVTPRTSGTPVNGRIAPVDGTPYPITASIAPLGNSVLSPAPEGARKHAKWNLFTEPSVILSANPPGDLVATSKGLCRVVGEADFTAHRTGRPGRIYYLAQEDSSGR